MGAASLVDEAVRWMASARNAGILFGYEDEAIIALVLIVAVVFLVAWWRRRRDPAYRYR